MHTKLIILDRDGTINRDSDDYIKSPDEWLPLPGAIEAIARLCQGGWHIAIASNQSGLGRGLFDLATLNLMHDKMNKLLAAAGGRVDAIFFCPHLPQDHCQCRKPLPGLFEKIGERFGVALDQVHAVGDTLRDAQAAALAGCQTHLVCTGKSEGYSGSTPPENFPPQTMVHDNLSAFADWVLAQGETANRPPSRASVR
ncbi:MAG: D-glycero-beta-D-manno-heptose 1,7-bisphosphate 7-phosphatase [Burkholderiaceae bacterium]|jgi:D-glycero-D-manno-heptose 1,7-bisphosphate phosphatase|nr:D-glycero-beta-D-manno-heptose 1,7-bisphosphate 7-phosphatase [Burkholderiaceae bacterium]